jgi:hypothetical protein
MELFVVDGKKCCLEWVEAEVIVYVGYYKKCFAYLRLRNAYPFRLFLFSFHQRWIFIYSGNNNINKCMNYKI